MEVWREVMTLPGAARASSSLSCSNYHPYYSNLSYTLSRGSYALPEVAAVRQQ
jgi:hypothetical protein